MPEVKRADETMKERKLEREVMLEAPVDDVWKALTERHRGIDRKVAWPRVQVSVTREEAYRKLMRPDGLFTADAGATLKSGETYSLATTTGESFTGQVQFVRVPRGF